MFQLSDNAKMVLEKRYLIKDKAGKVIETPEQMFSRVARTIAGAEVHDMPDIWEERYFKIMSNLEFLPNSPTLINAGRQLGQLSACFVLPLEDSMDSIFTTLRDAVLIQKSGGGTGFSFSELRPKGTTVKSTQKCAGGPVAFMRVFDSAMAVIAQGGVRHGANIGILRVDHPDIEEFITCKQVEGDISNFNISVGITEDFMRAVEEDTKHTLINPTNGMIVSTIDARDLLDKIVNAAWSNGEPGLLFLDEINRHNMTPHLGEIAASNPCVTGDTPISTTMGEIPISELSGMGWYDVYTCGDDGKLTIKPARFFMTANNKKILRIKTTRGDIRCTPDHKILTPDGYVMAKDLKLRQRIVGLNRKKHNERYLSVALAGSKGYKGESRLIMEYYHGDLHGMDVHHINGNFYDNRVCNLEVLSHGVHSRLTNVGNANYGNRCGVNGRFVKKLTPLKKKSKMPKQGKRGINWYVIGIEEAGSEAVYDGQVMDTHNYIANNIVVHNCGEQPLLPYESCNLGSLNLGRFVKAGKIDWNRLTYVVTTAVRFLDNVIDMNKYPITQVETRTKSTRKIGLGIMGFADMLIRLNIRYDSEAAVALAATTMRYIREAAIAASIDLAEIRGVFPAYRGSTWHKAGIRIRNAGLTTVAPTGTLSIIGNCSSGIEPYFSKSTKRHILNTILDEEVEFAKEDCFITAHNVSPEWHIKIQAAFQKYSDSAVSKTINFSKLATKADVYNAYMLAHRLRCKGITVYRDGSRDTQVLTHSDTCPECGAELINEGGCQTCSAKCGWSACKVG